LPTGDCKAICQKGKSRHPAYWEAATSLIHVSVHCPIVWQGVEKAREGAMDSTLRVAQSMIATKYKNPFLIGM
jgi:hypothetical protein